MKNKVHLELISMKEAKEIDKNATGYGDKVIWSPHTSVIDTKVILNHMLKEIQNINPNFKIHKNTKYIKSNHSKNNINEI